ncbi:bifunctional RNase H/acid phosphatase [Micromonospora sp. WMMD882]|uniref:bifunctional RNase H/acid phosphatase n=1 Tax=Micromonospora sp. WMMD882 TaxID=3015151 RepID=UPI00248ADB7C|nr:bifunctional RNase H/acid phosphatase [Micromonospora sp. WMMD882]WBB79832.1 bifunctional RNase H/acid phosphatase [Micromonospora sp. WMMD882]WBB79841.1 bifunctional RNase H/acid phosphatase [Micromonospora sp. WMMD882]
MSLASVVVEADGGSRGNPGPAGYGAVVREADTGEVLLERAEAIGTATNNVAEYRGLIAGLAAAAELGASRVEAKMDSKLVVEQMCGRWQIKNPGLRPLAAEAAALVRRFDAVTFTWIPRERNRHADALANAAMDAAAGRTPKRSVVEPPRIVEPPRELAAPDSPARAAAREAAARATAGRTATSADPAAAPTGPAPVAAPTAPGPTDAAPTAPGPAATGADPTTGSASWEPRAAAEATRLILVRHGQTEWTAQRRYSGRGDVPLSPRGREQARATAARVAALAPAVAAVVSSPLSRCTATARPIAAALGGVPLRTSDDLVECDFGAWEGRTFAEVRQEWPGELDAWLASPAVAPPDGESFVDVAARVGRARDALLAGHPGQTVVVVSHVSPIKLLLRDALAAGDAFLHRLYLDPAGICVLDVWPDGGVAVRSVNDTAHLT